ncbi:thiamine-phosphate kinase [soil metagenome]
MAIGEFDLISKYFTRPSARSAARDSKVAAPDTAASDQSGVQLGIGDDCALLRLGRGMQLATSCDMLVEGRHFLSTVKPEYLGHKALAVNLSDLAACGARPLAFTLALSMPRADEEFLAGFARGMFELADAHGCELMGGDTTQGPLNICITVMGEVPAGAALLRSGARVGDLIYVSGMVGDARLALEAFRGTRSLSGDTFDRVRVAMEQPQPRVALGIALRGIATSAIDVSDGLLGDLAHVLSRSEVGARIDVDALPRSADMAAQPGALQRLCTLSGGDDYELIFTAAPRDADAVQRAAQSAGVAVTRIGQIEAEPGVRLVDARDEPIADRFASFDHFLPHD